MSSKGKSKPKDSTGKPDAGVAAGAGAKSDKGAQADAPDKKPGKGHRQKGAGTVVKSKGEVTVQGLTMKEWERTPMTMINEYCQHNKRPKPIYQQTSSGARGYAFRLILPDPKRPGSDKDLSFAPNATCDDELHAKHTVAVLALHHLEGDRPYERKLPEPYRTLWLELSKSSSSSSSKPAPAATAPAAAPAARSKPTDTSTVASEAESKATTAPPEPKILDVRLKGDVVSKAERIRLAHLAEQRRRERENRRKARLAALQAKNQDALVSMSADHRSSIAKALEAFKTLVQAHGASNAYVLEEDVEDELEARMLAMGFTQDIAEQAVDAVTDELGMEATMMLQSGKVLEESLSMEVLVQRALDWVIMTVPSEALPPALRTQKRTITVSRPGILGAAPIVAIKPADPVIVDALRAYGFSTSEATSYASSATGSTCTDPAITVYSILQQAVALQGGADAATSSAAEADVLADEIAGLQSIYADDCTLVDHIAPDGSFNLLEIQVQIPLAVSGSVDASNQRICVMINKQGGSSAVYPTSPPIAVLAPGSDVPFEGFSKQLLEWGVECWRNRSSGCGCIFDVLSGISDIKPQNTGQKTKTTEATPAATEKAGAPTLLALPQPAPKRSKSSAIAECFVPSRSQRERMLTHDKRWQDIAARKASNPAYQRMQASRQKLPAASYKSQIIDAVRDSRVVLIAGETGCGKTTQIPQFLLDHAIDTGAGGHTRIVCTQPRRLAAVGVASRVAEERVEDLGSVDSSVGYHIRGEKKGHPGTSLMFCTTGILLRKLNAGLGHVTHIIVDEVHERSVETDFLLAVLQQLLARRKDVKVILMSATMDANVFAEYFKDVNGGIVPVISIPGFVHPVKDVYREDIDAMLALTVPTRNVAGAGDGDAGDDADGKGQSGGAGDRPAKGLDFVAVAKLIAHVCKPENKHLRLGDVSALDDGCILVFLPGVPEIRRLERTMGDVIDMAGLHVLQLHGNLSAADQMQVFRRPPAGKRKVVLSTNVAETSVTIDDVTVVIDTLRVKELTYDPINKTSRLAETWTSQASARQRRGRAGRVKPGICYRMVGRGAFSRLPAFQVPEIQRTPLGNLCLQVLSLGLGPVSAFMRTLPDPPAPSNVDRAVAELVDMEAVNASKAGEHTLTALGQHLANLPIDAKLGKALIVSCVLRCVDPVLTIVASLSDRSPVRPLPIDAEQRSSIAEARKQCVWANSDHLFIARAFQLWRDAGAFKERRKFADACGFSHEGLSSIADIRADLAACLADLGFLQHHRHDTTEGAKRKPTGAGVYGELSSAVNTFSNEANVVRAALTAGFYPSVAKIVTPDRRYHETATGAVPMDFKPKEIKFFTLADVKPPTATAAKAPSSAADDDGGDGASSSSSSEDEDTALLTAETDSKVWRGHALQRVFLHPGSVNFDVGEFRSPWMIFHEKAQTDKVYIRDSTMVTPYALLLFGGELNVKHEDSLITVGKNRWITVNSEAKIAVLVRGLRNALQHLLSLKLETPHLDISGTAVVECIVKLLVSNGL